MTAATKAPESDVRDDAPELVHEGLIARIPGLAAGSGGHRPGGGHHLVLVGAACAGSCPGDPPRMAPWPGSWSSGPRSRPRSSCCTATGGTSPGTAPGP